VSGHQYGQVSGVIKSTISCLGKKYNTFFEFLQGFEQGILLPTLQTLKQRERKVGKRF